MRLIQWGAKIQKRKKCVSELKTVKNRKYPVIPDNRAEKPLFPEPPEDRACLRAVPGGGKTNGIMV